MERIAISKMLMNLLLHKRVLLFWGMAVFFLVMPWLLKSCGRPALLTSQVYENCAVLSVHDGDTMTVYCDERKVKVRLYCIDAPELSQDPWGRYSRDYLQKIAGGEVNLLLMKLDKYGRYVGKVISGNSDLNMAQIQNGNAAVYRRYCNDADYLSAENKARELGIGIWSSMGAHQQPWIWRQSR